MFVNQKVTFTVKIFNLLYMFMNHKVNTTKQSHQIWSVVQVHHLTSCQASW